MRIVTTLALALVGATLASAVASAEEPVAGSKVYKLHAQNGSHEYGTVALRPHGSSTEVEVHIVNAPPGVAQPAHVHPGTCAQLNPAPKYPLDSVLDGTSETTVAVPVAALLKEPMAVNIHKSTSALKDYVACADLKP